jgi:hypothetical protein
MLYLSILSRNKQLDKLYLEKQGVHGDSNLNEIKYFIDTLSSAMPHIKIPLHYSRALSFFRKWAAIYEESSKSLYTNRILDIYIESKERVPEFF